MEKGKENLISVNPDLPQFVVAPIQKGQALAKVLIQKEGKVVQQINLISSSDIAKSLFPPWPVIIGGILGLVIIGLIGYWWFRRPKQKQF